MKTYTIQDCSVNKVWGEPEFLLKGEPMGYAINRGGMYGFDTKTPIWGVTSDPCKQPNCYLVLAKFFDGSPIAIRYYKWNIVTFNP